MTQKKRSPGACGTGAVAEIGNRGHDLQTQYSLPRRKTPAATTRAFSSAHARNRRRAQPNASSRVPLILALRRSPSAKDFWPDAPDWVMPT
jgi:hypothetical protein